MNRLSDTDLVVVYVTKNLFAMLLWEYGIKMSGNVDTENLQSKQCRKWINIFLSVVCININLLKGKLITIIQISYTSEKQHVYTSRTQEWDMKL
jgi:hypothetical protein